MREILFFAERRHSGNNVVCFKGSTTSPISQSGANLDFEYVQVPSQAPTTTANANAACVNVFYVVNTIHDISYRYGFTEPAFKCVFGAVMPVNES